MDGADGARGYDLSASEPCKRPVVLVVDDDGGVRRAVGRALERDGLEALVVADGTAGMAAFDERAPDLVLLDVQMPGLDGFELCETIRSRPGGREVPVVMMTGLDDVEAIRRAYDVGATDFITKPINWIILGHRVRYLLRSNDNLQALRRSQEKLSAAQKLAGMGSWQLDASTGELQVSEALWHLVGLLSRNGASVQAFAERIHPDDRASLRDAIQRCTQTGRTVAVDHRLIRADGALRLCHCQIRPVFGENGELLALDGVTQDLTERRRTEEQIRFLVSHDSLTSLGNRRLLRERLDLALRLGRRQGHHVGLIFLDLDHFKRINETLGHSVGDSLLREVAERLVTSVREADLVARSEAETSISRLGGDEFTILLPKVRDAQSLAGVARRMLDAISKPVQLEGHQVVLGGSIGISVFPGDGEDSETLLSNAETAMYHAKEQGRNNHQFYASSMNAVALRRLILEGKLRAALDRSEFEVFYQPKIELATGHIVGFEGLVRWLDPELGMVMPGDFIPIAEETGLILQLGEWVLAEACRQAREWDERGLCNVPIAVNLSPQQFKKPHLAQRIIEIVEASGVQPSRIGLEVTESGMLHDPELVIRELQTLRDAGLELALDDFGTGYSSLSYLRQLPVHTLKIDRSFIMEIETSEEAATFTASIVAMGKAIGLQLVAEGVENEAQRALLTGWGCDQVQGFLFSRPIPAKQAEAFWHATMGA